MKILIILAAVFVIIFYFSCKENSTEPFNYELNERLIKEAILKYKYPDCNFTHTIFIAYAVEDSSHKYHLIGPDAESIKIFKNICPGFKAYSDSIFKLYGELNQKLTFYPIEYLSPGKAKIECSYMWKREGYGDYYYLHRQTYSWVVDSLELSIII